MRQILIFLVIVAVALAMGMGGPVAAQENVTSSGDDRTDSDLEDTVNETGPTVSPGDDFMQQIDNETRITDWGYRPGMFTITIESESQKRVSMTEAGDFERGTGTFNYKEVELDEGTNTVTMPVTDRQGAGIAIATARSLEQGGGAYVSVGQVQQNPFRHFGGESGLFSGVGMTVGFAALGAWYVVRSEESGVIKA